MKTKYEEIFIYLRHENQEESESGANQNTDSHNSKQHLIQLRIQQNRCANNADNGNSEDIVHSYCDLVSSVLYLNLCILELPCQEDPDDQENTFITRYPNHKLYEIIAITSHDLLVRERVGEQVLGRV